MIIIGFIINDLIFRYSYCLCCTINPQVQNPAQLPNQSTFAAIDRVFRLRYAVHFCTQSLLALLKCAHSLIDFLLASRNFRWNQPAHGAGQSEYTYINKRAFPLRNNTRLHSALDYIALPSKLPWPQSTMPHHLSIIHPRTVIHFPGHRHFRLRSQFLRRSQVSSALLPPPAGQADAAALHGGCCCQCAALLFI